MLENTEGGNQQWRETGNIGYTIRKKPKNTTQYVLDTTMRKQKHNTICVGRH